MPAKGSDAESASYRVLGTAHAGCCGPGRSVLPHDGVSPGNVRKQGLTTLARVFLHKLGPEVKVKPNQALPNLKIPG